MFPEICTEIASKPEHPEHSQALNSIFNSISRYLYVAEYQIIKKLFDAGVRSFLKNHTNHLISFLVPRPLEFLAVNPFRIRFCGQRIPWERVIQ